MWKISIRQSSFCTCKKCTKIGGGELLKWTKCTKNFVRGAQIEYDVIIIENVENKREEKSMKKRFMALLMALVLVLGTTSTVFAANSSGGDNTQEVKTVGVRWYGWSVAAENLDDIKNVYLQYTFSLFSDAGELLGTFYNGTYNQDGFLAQEEVWCNLSDNIEELGSGKYYVSVTVSIYGYDENGYYIGQKIIGSGTSDIATYKAPANQLAAPNATVENGVLTFDKVAGADFYSVKVKYPTYTSNSAYDATYLNENIFLEDYYMEGNDIVKYVNGGKSIQLDFASWFEERESSREENYSDYVRPDYDFTFYVQAKTYDIDAIRNSEITNAGQYIVRKSAEQLNAVLDAVLTDEAIAANPLAAKDVLVNTNNETLITMMADPTFKAKVVKAEAAYAEAMNLPPAVAVSTSAAVDQTKISVVGALLNATGEGQQVALSVADAVGVTAPAGYTNGVALDIKLFVGEDSITNLEVPVQITMPVPAGVALQNLVILHYHEGATVPTVIVPTVNADGTMTFAVDGFSTFVVANQTAVALPFVAPKTGDMVSATLVLSMLLLAAGAVVIMRRKSFVK